MSAEATWHKDAPEKHDQPIVPQAYVSWMQALRALETSAPPQEPASGAPEHPEPSPDGPPLADETIATLLRAIEGTEVARLLGVATPAGNQEAPAPKVAFSAKITALSFTRPARNTAASPAPMLLVQSPPCAASTWLSPPTNASPRFLVTTLLPNAAESLRASVAAPALSLPRPIAAESSPAITPARPPASIDDRLPSAPVFAALNEGAPLVAAKVALIAERIRRVCTQLSSALRNWIAAEAVPGVMRLGRATVQSSAQLRNGAVTSAAAAMERMRRAGAQFSSALSDWIAAAAVPGMKRLGRATARSSARLKNGAVTSAAAATKRMARSSTQLATGLRNRSHAEPAAAVAPQHIARTRTQPSDRLQSWFGPRRSQRLVKPPVVAWCWAADTPHSLKIADISSGGIHLLTDVRWPLGGTVPMTLQRTDRSKHAPGSWIVIDFTVVRWCDDGVAGFLIPPTPYSIASGSENCADHRTLKHFVKQLARPAR
jgi:hypothetical protein